MRLETSSLQTDSSVQHSAGPSLQSWQALTEPILEDARAWLQGAPSSALLQPTVPEHAAEQGSAQGQAGSVASSKPTVAAASSDLSRILAWEQHTCEACSGRVINGAEAWAAHTAGKAHKRALGRKAWQAAREAAGAAGAAVPEGSAAMAESALPHHES